MKNSFYILSLLLIVLNSCGSSSSVTNNFSIQKRKYNKGWNVKDLFRHKQNGDAAEVELNSKKQDEVQNLANHKPLRKKQVEEITTKPIDNEVISSLSEIEETAENHDVDVKQYEEKIKNDFPLPNSNQDRIVKSENNSDSTSTVTDENESDSLFRVFYIMGFVLVIITIILSLLQFTGDIALIFLMILFLFDVASIVVFIICLVRRAKNPEKYKEKSWMVLLTELLFGAASFLALITWGIFNF